MLVHKIETMMIKYETYLKHFLKTINKTSNVGLSGELALQSSIHSNIPTGATSRSQKLASS